MEAGASILLGKELLPCIRIIQPNHYPRTRFFVPRELQRSFQLYQLDRRGLFRPVEQHRVHFRREDHFPDYHSGRVSGKHPEYPQVLRKEARREGILLKQAVRRA